MSPSSFVPPSTPGFQRSALSVSQLNALIRDTLQAAFPRVWVRGEITDLSRPQSGHVYLSLKDDQSQLRAVMWRNTASRLRFDLQDGMEVLCEGMVDVYPPRGTYQLIIQQIEPRGIGALQLALMQLREKLAAEGLFDPLHKQPLPRFPRQIAVITSPTGAAIRDFLEIVRRRWRGAKILVIPSRVQGTEATEEIIQAMRTAHRLRPLPDLLVLARGGGSLDDLWCFNEERLVREIHAARIPIISAIGHEIDVTLADLVADLRALTPTAAGEHAVPSQSELLHQLHSLARLMSAALQRRWQAAKVHVEALAQRRALADPHQLIHDRMHQLDDIAGRLNRAVAQRQVFWRQQTDQWTGRLQTLNPLAVLERGYSLTQRSTDEAIVRDSRQVQPGDEIRTRLAKGQLISRVIEALDDSTTRKEPGP
jgi:exodeoxyribonuclease VII large subunit